MWEHLIIEGVDARQSRDRAQFKLGDLALQVETHYGDHSLWNYAQPIGIEFHQLQSYRTVARAYEESVRTDNLSWTHHERVASRGDRLDWLDKAEQHRWSVSEMVQAIRESEGCDMIQIHLQEARDALWEALHVTDWDSLTLEESLAISSELSMRPLMERVLPRRQILSPW